METYLQYYTYKLVLYEDPEGAKRPRFRLVNRKNYMNMAIQAIIYGDRYLFKEYPQLINTPIYVKFDSDFPLFNNYESYKFTIDL